MESNRQTVLQLLKNELEFLDKGGYKHNPRSPWRAPYIFEDSPSCPNSSDRARPHLCEECWLMQFVAPELQEEQIPCRFVDLTENGVTVTSTTGAWQKGYCALPHRAPACRAPWHRQAPC